MRITVLARRFPPTVGGIADHTDLLARELATRGHEVTVVCSPPADPREHVAVHAVIERWDAKGFDAIAHAVGGTRPDAILWQYNPFEIGRRGLAPSAGRLARALAATAPLTVYFHELWFPWGRNGLKGLLWAVTQRLQARGVLKAARRWIVTTESRERALSDPKATRIPVGTNVEPTGERAAVGGDFVLAHLGSTGPGRDLRPAYDAIARLRAEGIDARLLLAGDTGPLDIPPAILDAVITTGTTAHARDLSPYLAAAHAYLHADPVGPSAGRRTSIVAALAHGLPVIAYRGPDHASELVDGTNIILVEPDGTALADAVRSLIADPARAREIGEAGRRTFEDHFSWRRIGDAVSLLLSEA